MTGTEKEITVLTDKVESLDGFILYRKVRGKIPSIKQGQHVALDVKLSLQETKQVLYYVHSVEYVKDTFTANLLFIRFIG